MLRKLLKYDLRSMRGLWRVFSILLPCLALALPISFRLMSWDYDVTSGYVVLLQIIVYFIFLILIYAAMAVLIINPVFLAKRIARDFYSRTAQLTLTLPVKRDDLFLSKLINSIIWTTATNVFVLVTVILCMLIMPVPESGLISTVAFDTVGAFIRAGIAESGAFFVIKMILGIILVLEINLFCAVFLNYSVIKCHSMGGIGMYLGVVIGGICGILMLMAIGIEGYDLITMNMSPAAVGIVGVLSMLALDVIFAILNVALCLYARDKLKYNFNLT